MAAAFKLLAVTFVVALTLAGAGVSAETHHVVGGDGGWGPDFNVTAWLFGRLFTVGDKLRFEYAGGDEKIVEVGGAEEFVTCNLTNPIRMLTDLVSHVALEEEGVRYFTSADPESCRKGLKLPVTVAAHDFDPSPPHDPYSPPHDPYHPDVPSPPYEPYKVPPPHDPYSPPHDPYHPDVPSPPYEPYKVPPPHDPNSPPHDPYSPPYEPYHPDVPSPPYEPYKVPPPPSPSAAARRNGGLCLVLAAAMCLAV